MRVFVSAGEASGDAYGAALVEEMRRLRGGLSFEGIGGSRMAAAGVSLVAESNRWGAISVVQGIRVLPRVWSGYWRTKAMLRQRPRGLFVPIDFGFVNIKLARHAKEQGWKVLYFVPPGSWRRDRQGADLPRLADAISTPFSWSAEILSSMGANAHWFGHPIKQLIAQRPHHSGPRDTLAVLPGSREHEIDANLPVIAEAVKGLERQLEFGLAPATSVERFRARWQALSGRTSDRFYPGGAYEALTRARAAIVCSGTATLEAALCRCPMVVVYRTSRLMELEAKLLRVRVPKYVSLPNILLDRQVVPELIRDGAQPGPLREALEGVLADGPVRATQLSDFEALDAMLGPADAISRTAELGLSLVPSSEAA